MARQPIGDLRMTSRAWQSPTAVSQLAMLVVLPAAAGRVLMDRPVVGVLPEYSSTLLYASDLLVLAAVGLWLAGHLRSPARPLRAGPWFIWIPLAVLTALSLLSLTWSWAPPITAELAARLVVLGAVYLMLVDGTVGIGLLAGALTLGMALQSALAVLQFGRQGSLGLSWLGEPAAEITAAGLWVRGVGLTRHPNILGGYLILGLAATLGLAALRPGARWTWTAWVLGATGLVATFSRSAWLGLAVGLAGVGIALWTAEGAERRANASAWRRLAGVLAAVGLGSVLLFPAYLSSRLVTPIASMLEWSDAQSPPIELDNLAERAHYRAVADGLLASRPATGVGGGAFAVASQRADPHQPAGHAYLPVHDVRLLLLSELGPLAGVAWGLLVLGVGAALIRHRRRLAREPWLMAWSLALLGLFTTSLLDSYLWSWQSGRLLLFVALGLWARAYGQSEAAVLQ